MNYESLFMDFVSINFPEIEIEVSFKTKHTMTHFTDTVLIDLEGEGHIHFVPPSA